MVNEIGPIAPAQRISAQIWQVLIARATDKQLILYAELAELIGRKGQDNLLGPYLDRVSAFCAKSQKPDITVLVINASEGRPGKLSPDLDLDMERLEVFHTPGLPSTLRDPRNSEAPWNPWSFSPCLWTALHDLNSRTLYSLPHGKANGARFDGDMGGFWWWPTIVSSNVRQVLSGIFTPSM